MPSIQNPPVISEFNHRFSWLSNFAPTPFSLHGFEYATAEHAYQAAKAVDIEDRVNICNALTPGAAKRLGRKVECRSDWDDIRVEVMREVLAAKFEDPDLLRLLMDTVGSYLVEGNHWGDRFWGVCAGRGHNMLGRLLMELRDSKVHNYVMPTTTEKADDTPSPQPNQA